MSFDMKIVENDKTDIIDYDEELIFYINDLYELECSELNSLWEKFYDGPRIYPNQSENLVNEIEKIESFTKKYQGQKCPKEIIERTQNPKYQDVFITDEFYSFLRRIKSFFGEAVKLNSIIETYSD